MKIVALEDAEFTLSEYSRRNRRDAVILTRRGKPVSALVPLEPGVDLERLSVAADPRFRGILARSRAEIREGKVLGIDEMRHSLGIKGKTK